jgi:menaquinone-dependent protoporphyrinogen oxidase
MRRRPRESSLKASRKGAAMSILVAYATKYGSTREVAERVADVLRAEGLETELRAAADVQEIGAYDGVVLGAGLYMGGLHADARRFLKRHRQALAARPPAIFAMGPKTLSEADVAGSRKQLDAALAKLGRLEPVSTAIFGGVIRPEELRFPLNRMEPSDARNWDAIEAWARELARVFDLSLAAVPARA